MINIYSECIKLKNDLNSSIHIIKNVFDSSYRNCVYYVISMYAWEIKYSKSRPDYEGHSGISDNGSTIFVWC